MKKNFENDKALFLAILKDYAKFFGTDELIESFVSAVHTEIPDGKASDVLAELFKTNSARKQVSGSGRFVYLNDNHINDLLDTVLDDEVEQRVDEAVDDRLSDIEEPDSLNIPGCVVIPCKTIPEQIKVEAFLADLKANPYQLALV
jgi:hypothetical protein